MFNQKFSYQTLATRFNRLKTFTGLKMQEFLDLKNEFQKEWELHKSMKTIKPNRKRAIGGGRKSVVPNFEDRMVIFLFYAKYYPSYSLIEAFFDIDNATVCRIINEMIVVFGKKILIDKNRRHITKPEELFYLYPELRMIILDATEQKIHKKDNTYYSGKAGKKTIKTQIIIDQKGKILYVENFCKGKKHDSRYLQESHLGEWLKKKPPLMATVDLGYYGMDKVFPIPIFLPKKKATGQKELSLEDKNWNKKIHSERVKVEHAFARLKKYQILAQGYRNRVSNYSNVFRAIAGVVNLRMGTS